MHYGAIDTDGGVAFRSVGAPRPLPPAVASMDYREVDTGAQHTVQRRYVTMHIERRTRMADHIATVDGHGIS